MLRTLFILTSILVATAIFAASPLSQSLYMPVLNRFDAPIFAQEQSPDEPFSGENELFDSGKQKDLKKSFLFSLLLPGAGEFYAGNYYKAGAFFLLEAAGWMSVIIYQNKGDDGEDAYRRWADENWEYRYYYSWFHALGNDSIYTEQLPVTIHYDYGDTASEFAYTIFVVDISGDTTPVSYVADKDHDYYEMIGKYDWFILGWKDLPNRDAIRDSASAAGNMEDILKILKAHENDSGLRLSYMTMRKDANDYFTISKYIIGAVILNHVISAFDAAWTAKRSNDKLYEGFTFAPKFEAGVAICSNGTPEPHIALNIARF